MLKIINRRSRRTKRKNVLSLFYNRTVKLLGNLRQHRTAQKMDRTSCFLDKHISESIRSKGFMHLVKQRKYSFISLYTLFLSKVAGSIVHWHEFKKSFSELGVQQNIFITKFKEMIRYKRQYQALCSRSTRLITRQYRYSWGWNSTTDRLLQGIEQGLMLMAHKGYCTLQYLGLRLVPLLVKYVPIACLIRLLYIRQSTVRLLPISNGA